MNTQQKASKVKFGLKSEIKRFNDRAQQAGFSAQAVRDIKNIQAIESIIATESDETLAKLHDLIVEAPSA